MGSEFVNARLNLGIAEFLNTRGQLRYELCRNLAGGYGIDAGWYRVAVKLSTLGMNINMSWIEDIQSVSQTSAMPRVDEFLGRIGQLVGLDVKLFIRALRQSGQEVMALRFEAEARGEVASPAGQTMNLVFNAAPSLPAAGPTFGNPLVQDFRPVPPVALISEVTDHADVFYNEEFYALIKVPRSTQIDEGCKRFFINCTVDFIKGKKRACDEANARFNKEIEAAGGEESKAAAGYIVLPTTVGECYFPETKEVKSRRRENPRAAKK